MENRCEVPATPSALAAKLPFPRRGERFGKGRSLVSSVFSPSYPNQLTRDRPRDYNHADLGHPSMVVPFDWVALAGTTPACEI